MRIEHGSWSGDGTFTKELVDALQRVAGIAAVRVDDAPASRSEADYNFISNEVFVVFSTTSREERTRRFGFLPRVKTIHEPAMTLAVLEQHLAALPGIGAPDYSDDGMLQYLRTERVVPPYQTRGYKIVELVRLYVSGSRPTQPA